MEVERHSQGSLPTLPSENVIPAHVQEEKRWSWLGMKKALCLTGSFFNR